MEGITDAGYGHAKRVCKYFEIKYLGEYDLCVQYNTLLLCFLKYINLIPFLSFQLLDEYRKHL